MNEDVFSLIRYRLQQAEESLKEALVLRDQGMSRRSVINRLYYGMFYAVLGLLQEKRMGTSKHIGAIALFDKEFIKAGLFSKDLSKTLHRVFELRQKADYLQEAEVTEEDVTEIFPRVIKFVEEIKKYFQR
ncbi:MAG TPA: hypothetical protein DCY12_08955 [Candidatus Atribacteria bacterium]|nr:hypothetical protein [Candidatus Atribacteria bacterium]